MECISAFTILCMFCSFFFIQMLPASVCYDLWGWFAYSNQCSLLMVVGILIASLLSTNVFTSNRQGFFLLIYNILGWSTLEPRRNPSYLLYLQAGKKLKRGITLTYFKWWIRWMLMTSYVGDPNRNDKCIIAWTCLCITISIVS